ncbi:hypothetical protein NDU88_002124 [Pleurodeles waltl]|uniref:Uncharacterized protein n=1 Tax=Pleurodeles waltl TaxID=8319 RepID=A0AAV7W2D0_PLEWA|nr:hypothetical protein NDU88_002124 [Pleurodeles waltl]
MTESLDKHMERLDQSKRRVSEVEDGQTQLAAGHVKLSKEVHSLLLKVDDLEVRSWRNKLHIVVTPDQEALLDYLTHINMPRLTDKDRDVLMAPLMLEEMDGALTGMGKGKAPGTDGPTVRFYKAYKNLLLWQLKDVYDEMKGTVGVGGERRRWARDRFCCCGRFSQQIYIAYNFSTRATVIITLATSAYLLLQFTVAQKREEWTRDLDGDRRGRLPA